MIHKLAIKLSHLFHPIKGEIWCLHRVVKQRSIYPSNRELEITPDYLEELIKEYKAAGYAFVSIDELLLSKSILPQKRVNVSFDDGFRDVYTNAFPIFKEHQIPFTIYLTTGFPEGKADIWWIQMEQDRSVEDYENLMKLIYGSGESMAREMHELTDTQPDLLLSHSLSLSWKEIKEIISFA